MGDENPLASRSGARLIRAAPHLRMIDKAVQVFKDNAIEKIRLEEEEKKASAERERVEAERAAEEKQREDEARQAEKESRAQEQKREEEERAREQAEAAERAARQERTVRGTQSNGPAVGSFQVGSEVCLLSMTILE